jgi:hypothetical protein
MAKSDLAGDYDSVVRVGCLRSRSPTENRGKVVDSRQRPNVRDFMQCLESPDSALDLIHNSRFGSASLSSARNHADFSRLT